MLSKYFLPLVILCLGFSCSPFKPDEPFDVNFTVNTESGRQAISPLIYGTNQLLSGGENFTVRRFGGNRTTGYNWENNASNAGEDWYNSSDDFLCSHYFNRTAPKTKQAFKFLF